MRRWGRWTLWIVLLGLAAAGIVYALLPKPVEVDLAAATRGPLQVTVDEDGQTRIKEKYIVSSPVGGQLVRINLKAGDPIEAGKSILATIRPSDPTILDARQVAEAEARVAAARVTIERAGARKGQTDAAKELAESQYARAQQLFESNSLSQSEFDAALAIARQRAEELRAATFDEEIARFELQQAEAALLRVQPTTSGSADAVGAMQNFEITSPIDGNVLRVLQESATVVQPGTELLEVGNRADLEIVIDVLSTDAVQIQPGAEVWLEHWGGDHPLRANVRRIEPAAFTKISSLGVEEQRVNVIADFDEPSERISPLGDGFRVEARIVTWKGSDVLRIPASAPFRIGGDWFVFRNVDGRARKTRIELGHRNAMEAEVLGGLNEGDSIVAYPDDRISDGVQLIDRSLQATSSLSD